MKKILRFFEFVNNTLFYWQRGHKIKDAMEMARKVLPG